MKELAGFILVAMAVVAVGFFGPKDEPITQVEQIGAVPTLMTDSVNFNGMEHVYKTQRMNQATTTLCQIQAPRHATSTLAVDSLLKMATSTDYTLTIGKGGTDPNSTSTLIRQQSVTADGQIAMPMASSTGFGDTNRTFAPGDWLVVKSSSGIINVNGTCYAKFVVGS